MKTKIEVLVVRNKQTNEVLEATGICDMYSPVQVVYPANMVSESELVEYLKRVYGDRWASAGSSYIENRATRGSFCMEAEAKDLPSIGDVLISTEEIYVDIP